MDTLIVCHRWNNGRLCVKIKCLTFAIRLNGRWHRTNYEEVWSKATDCLIKQDINMSQDLCQYLLKLACICTLCG